MEKSKIYQESYAKELQHLQHLQTEKGSVHAVRHAKCYKDWLVEQDDFRFNDDLQGEYDACEKFLTDLNALAS
jgi:hypothetical protein